MLSANDRPEDIHHWIKKHRRPKDMPDITPYFDKFVDGWQKWWAGLHTRSSEGDEPDYPEMKKAGPNGIFLLILSLVWWGCAATEKGEVKMDEWRATVGELTATVKKFNAQKPTGPKRLRGNSEAASRSSKYVPLLI